MRPQRSILAGCIYSVALTRVLLHRGVADLVVCHPSTALTVYVDDLAQLTTGPTGTVLVRSVAAAKALVAMGRALKLRFASKSQVVASQPRLAKVVVRALAQVGCCVKGGLHVRDLGVTFHSLGARRRGVAVGRLARARRRLSIIASWARKCKRAKRLVPASPLPLGLWGARGVRSAVVRLCQFAVPGCGGYGAGCPEAVSHHGNCHGHRG